MRAGRPDDSIYASRVDQERRHFDAVGDFDDLPPIYHYWSNAFVRVMLERIGCANTLDFLSRYLLKSAQRCEAEQPIFLSIGSGDASNELKIARQLKRAGLSEFTIECLELNPTLISRASSDAREAGLASHLIFVEQDLNRWHPTRAYHGVVANQSLHHVSNLEELFDGVRSALAPGAFFVVNDIVGRNGHRRWPEARRLIDRFWPRLPSSYRENRQLRRYEQTFEDWDCSFEGFEGIRSQDVLPQLIDRFSFHVFVGFANIVDPFVDRAFGPNFSADAAWDRAFIDRVHACDERALSAGILTPTHMLAVIANDSCDTPYHARGLAPEACVRDPNRTISARESESAERMLVEYFDIPARSAVESSPKRVALSVRLIGCVTQIDDVCGPYSDGWVARMMEFTVHPERDVSRFVLHLTVPEGMPTGTELSVDVNGTRVNRLPATRATSIDCSALLVKGTPARIRIASSAAINLKELGLGDDARDLGFRLDDAVFEP